MPTVSAMSAWRARFHVLCKFTDDIHGMEPTHYIAYVQQGNGSPFANRP
jgi:hypothetical protein